MLPRIKRWFKRLIWLITTIVLVFTAALVTPWHFTPYTQSEQSYATWMVDHVAPDTRLVDLPMLGAHDAFAIDLGLFSLLDPVAYQASYTNSLLAPPLGWLIKGFMIRQSNTQNADVTTLLEAGVRYFDVRLTYQETWHFTHNYLAPGSVTETFEALAAFLKNHPGEVVLLDFQWVFDARTMDRFADASTYEDVLILLEASGLMPFVLPAEDVDIETLTYGEATDITERAALLLVAKTRTDHPIYFNREHQLRSSWHNTDNIETLRARIAADIEWIEAHPELKNRFRVMQAVKTIQIDGAGVVNSIMTWSLLNRARLLNAALIEDEHFCTQLATLPIVMLDFVDSNHQTALDRLMQCVIEQVSLDD